MSDSIHRQAQPRAHRRAAAHVLIAVHAQAFHFDRLIVLNIDVNDFRLAGSTHGCHAERFADLATKV